MVVWKSRPSGLKGFGCVSMPWRDKKAGPGRPGSRSPATCFLTPILLPVNPAALQPDWPDRTLWVLLPSCFVLHQAGSPALHSCSLPVVASYTQAQSWAVSKRTRNVLRGVVPTTLESRKVGSWDPLGKVKVLELVGNTEVCGLIPDSRCGIPSH